MTESTFSLVNARGRKYLTAAERKRFLAAVRTHPKPAVQTLAQTLALTGCRVFDDLTVLVDGAEAAFRSPELEYAISVDGNSFSDESGHINGGFFGPAHEEMAGVLDDRDPSVNLLAGFGGAR